jgi:S1-C subfamily serine protease
VVSGSPAERAGLRRGDVVTAVNDKPVRNADQLHNAIGLLPVGARVTLAVIRNGRPQQITATLGTPTDLRATGGNGRTNLAGAVLGEIEPDHPSRGHARGVQVLAVEPGSIAARAGILPDDIIVSVNRLDVDSTEEVVAAAARSPDRLLLNIQRGHTALFLVLR